MERSRRSQQYDVSLKLLFRRSTGVAASALFGGPVAEWLNVELPKVENPRIDLLARGSDDSLRHVEFQSKNDNQMPRRQAEYYLALHRVLGEHVDQVVLYVGQEPLRMQPVFETPPMRFQYRLLDIREWDGEPLLESEDLGDNMLALLTPVDQERVFARVEKQIRKLEGEEKEESRNIRKGIRQGETNVLLALLEERFGALPSWVTEQLEEASEGQLMAWAKHLLSAAKLEDVFTHEPARPNR